MSLEARADPYAFQEVFPTDSPFLNIDAELEKIKQESLKNPVFNPYKDISLAKSSTLPSSATASQATTLDDYYKTALPNYEEEQERDTYNAQLRKKYAMYALASEPIDKDNKLMFNAKRGMVAGPSSNFRVSQSTFN